MPRARKPAPGPSAAGGYQGGGNPGGGVQPPRAATGLPYGEHKQLVDSQQAIPMPQAPAAAAAATAGPPGQPAPTGAPAPNPAVASLQAALAASPGNPPGALTAPTQRPDEHVMAGAAGAMNAAPVPQGPNPDVVLFSKWMPALELLATSPQATSQTRQFYRLLRSQMPVAASPNVQAGAAQLGAAAQAQGL